jgi:hypothetical protein
MSTSLPPINFSPILFPTNNGRATSSTSQKKPRSIIQNDYLLNENKQLEVGPLPPKKDHKKPVKPNQTAQSFKSRRPAPGRTMNSTNQEAIRKLYDDLQNVGRKSLAPRSPAANNGTDDNELLLQPPAVVMTMYFSDPVCVRRTDVNNDNDNGLIENVIETNDRDLLSSAADLRQGPMQPSELIDKSLERSRDAGLHTEASENDDENHSVSLSEVNHKDKRRDFVVASGHIIHGPQ